MFKSRMDVELCQTFFFFFTTMEIMVLLPRSAYVLCWLMYFLLLDLTCSPGVYPSQDFLNIVDRGALFFNETLDCLLLSLEFYINILL